MRYKISPLDVPLQVQVSLETNPAGDEQNVQVSIQALSRHEIDKLCLEFRANMFAHAGLRDNRPVPGRRGGH